MMVPQNHRRSLTPLDPLYTYTHDGAHHACGYNYDVDWNNDGIMDQTGLTGPVTHDFGTAGIYTVRISGAKQIQFADGANDKLKILSIDQW